MASDILDVKDNRKLRVALARRGWKQFQLSRATGISEFAISLLVRGYRKPTPGQLWKFEKVFSRKELERIFDLDDETDRTN